MLIQLLRPNPRRDWQSRLAALRHYLALAAETFGIAACMTAAWWHFCWKFGWHLSSEDDTMLQTSIVVNAGIFAIPAALVFNSTLDRLGHLSRHVLTKNKRGFMEIRDERVRIGMHLVLAGFGLSMLVQICAYNYHTLAAGILIVFCAWFVMVLYFTATLEMQEPTRIIWLAKRIPKDWLAQGVDVYFEINGDDKNPCADTSPPKAQ